MEVAHDVIGRPRKPGRTGARAIARAVNSPATALDSQPPQPRTTAGDLVTEDETAQYLASRKPNAPSARTLRRWRGRIGGLYRRRRVHHHSHVGRPVQRIRPDERRHAARRGHSHARHRYDIRRRHAICYRLRTRHPDDVQHADYRVAGFGLGRRLRRGCARRRESASPARHRSPRRGPIYRSCVIPIDRVPPDRGMRLQSFGRTMARGRLPEPHVSLAPRVSSPDSFG